MNPTENNSPTKDPQKSVISRFNYLSWGEFNGLLTIQTSHKLWKILFYSGKIVWAIDGNSPNRFWQRLLFIHDQKLKLADLAKEKSAQSLVNHAIDQEVWQYLALINLLNQKKITVQQLQKIIKIGTEEVLFDLFQANHLDQLAFRSSQETFKETPLTQFDVDELLKNVSAFWSAWSKHLLMSVSPNQTPVINHPVKLYSQTSPIIYQNLITAINGTRTLREIALEMNQDLLLLTRSLIKYIQMGIIELIDLPDLPNPESIDSSIVTNKKSGSFPSKNTHNQNNKINNNPLIIYVDDSIGSCRQMESLTAEIGCRLITTNDSTKALPLLLENKPDIIFLDLIMPLVSGYEICGQLRRISVFSKTPIIVLTSRDGIIDRVKSKAIGASGLISKPLDLKKLKDILLEYNLIEPKL